MLAGTIYPKSLCYYLKMKLVLRAETFILINKIIKNYVAPKILKLGKIQHSNLINLMTTDESRPGIRLIQLITFSLNMRNINLKLNYKEIFAATSSFI